MRSKDKRRELSIGLPQASEDFIGNGQNRHITRYNRHSLIGFSCYHREIFSWARQAVPIREQIARPAGLVGSPAAARAVNCREELGFMPLFDATLADRVGSAIQTNPYLSGRTLRFEAHEGRVTLNGTVASYFQKQMAQEVIRRVEGVEQIENELEVTWC
jgi:hypothetical protein